MSFLITLSQFYLFHLLLILLAFLSWRRFFNYLEASKHNPGPCRRCGRGYFWRDPDDFCANCLAEMRRSS